jgi:hypothetical protein
MATTPLIMIVFTKDRRLAPWLDHYKHATAPALQCWDAFSIAGPLQNKHVQVEERRQCITAIREFSGKFTAMLAVL